MTMTGVPAESLPCFIPYDVGRRNNQIEGEPAAWQFRLVLISGPNGVGKDTLINAMMSNVADDGPTLRRIPRTTSRLPRPGEEDGIDYRFRTEEEIVADADRYLGITRYPGNDCIYALDRADYEGLEDGCIGISTAGIEFIGTLRSMYPAARSIYILPPSVPALAARLRGRGRSEATFKNRLTAGLNDWMRAQSMNGLFDLQLTNNSLHLALMEFAIFILGQEEGDKVCQRYRSRT